LAFGSSGKIEEGDEEAKFGILFVECSLAHANRKDTIEVFIEVRFSLFLKRRKGGFVHEKPDDRQSSTIQKKP
jgi:hypothetical protein